MMIHHHDIGGLGGPACIFETAKALERASTEVLCTGILLEIWHGLQASMRHLSLADQEPGFGTLERHEASGPSVRLGLRYARGLRKEAALAIEAECRRSPFRSLADLAARVALRRDELDTLAELGALEIGRAHV